MKHKALTAILLVALLLRLAGGVVVARQIKARHGTSFLFPDSHNFWAYATHLVDQGVYQDHQGRKAWRTPLYSIFLAGLYRTGVESPASLRLFVAKESKFQALCYEDYNDN